MVDKGLNGEFGLPNDPEIRMGFVKKVYGILSVQMLVTTIFAGICLSARSDPGFVNMMNDPGLTLLAVFFQVSTLCALACCRYDK